MNLDESQRKKITEWIAEGLKLSDIQKRLVSELGIGMTYMDVRLLVDDLKLTPKDPERPKPAAAPVALPGKSAPAAAGPGPASALAGAETKPGGVSVEVDQIARAGALVSGKVRFSDGNAAEWHLDQTGRLGLAPKVPGYKPPAADLQQFQAALETELSKLGF